MPQGYPLSPSASLVPQYSTSPTQYVGQCAELSSSWWTPHMMGGQNAYYNPNAAHLSYPADVPPLIATNDTLLTDMGYSTGFTPPQAVPLIRVIAPGQPDPGLEPQHTATSHEVDSAPVGMTDGPQASHGNYATPQSPSSPMPYAAKTVSSTARDIFLRSLAKTRPGKTRMSTGNVWRQICLDWKT